MKKNLLTLAAILCCAMTATIFTSCGGDDETPEPQKPEEQETPAVTQIPVSVRLEYYIENRPDMLKYLDMVVKCSDGKKEYTSEVLTPENMVNNYYFHMGVYSSELPASFKVWREVKVKEAYKDVVKDLDKFEFSTAIHYYYGLYDKDNKIIGSIVQDKYESIQYPSNQTKEMVNSYLSKLDLIYGRVYEINFDKYGIKSSRTQRD